MGQISPVFAKIQSTLLILKKKRKVCNFNQEPGLVLCSKREWSEIENQQQWIIFSIYVSIQQDLKVFHVFGSNKPVLDASVGWDTSPNVQYYRCEYSWKTTSVYSQCKNYIIMLPTLVDSPPFRFPVNSDKLFCGQEYCISLSVKFFWYLRNCEVMAEQ